MVDLTVYSMTTPFDATKYLQDLTTYVEERRQRTDYFFSSGDIQQSTAFTIVDKAGEWSDFYLGQVIVRANGNLAFLPHASLSGTVNGESIGQFATEMLSDGGNPNRFLRMVLGGDDVLRGGGGDDILYGHAGADHLYGGDGNDKLYGGGGDDIIEPGSGDSIGGATVSYCVGGAGRDTFILGDKSQGFMLGGEGRDVYEFEALTTYYSLIYFGDGDRIGFDRTVFTALPKTLTSDNFRFGTAQDADDFIIYDGTYLYYDRDGSGSAAAVRLAGVYNEGGGTSPDLSIDDFFVYRGDHDAVARGDIASGHALLPHAATTMSEPILLCLA